MALFLGLSGSWVGQFARFSSSSPPVITLKHHHKYFKQCSQQQTVWGICFLHVFRFLPLHLFDQYQFQCVAQERCSVTLSRAAATEGRASSINLVYLTSQFFGLLQAERGKRREGIFPSPMPLLGRQGGTESDLPFSHTRGGSSVSLPTGPALLYYSGSRTVLVCTVADEGHGQSSSSHDLRDSSHTHHRYQGSFGEHIYHTHAAIWLMRSGDRSPILVFLEPVHLHPCQQGQLYSVIQVPCRVHSPEYCT